MEKIKFICDGDYTGLRHQKFRKTITLEDMIKLYQKNGENDRK